jgi:hypothetical protein
MRLTVPGSIFDGAQLLPTLPRYATFDELLRFDSPPARRFRQIVEAWVAEDPPAARAKAGTDLVHRRTSLGTFHELLLREVLRREVGPVEREPKGLPVGQRNPDFGVRVARRKGLVVFESSTIAEKVDKRTERRRRIMRRLDRISGSWHLIPEWSWSHGLDEVRPSTVEAGVRRAMRGLTRLKHRLDIRFGEAVLRATLVPASRHRESIVSADFTSGVSYSPGVESIKDDVKTKTERYRGLRQAGIPFIVAIGSDWPLIDWETMFTALYGDERITLRFEGDEIVATEDGQLNYSGKITPNRRGEARHRTLSAAWLIRWRFRDDDLFAEVVHFPNPWATNPVRVPGRNIARVTFRRLSDLQVKFFAPRKLRLLKVS